MTATDSFIRGWNYGKANGRELSAREIAVQFPDVEEREFAQGNIDAICGDRFRLEIALKSFRTI